MAEAATAKIGAQDFTEEAVSAGAYLYGRQSIPPDVRDMDLPRFDFRAARQMRFDAEVHACIEFLVDAILADGIETIGALYESDEGFERAEKIKEFIYRSLFETPVTPLLPTLKELIRGAICYGYKVAEIVLRLEFQGQDAGFFVLDKIKIKPNRATAFVVDEFFNVLGLVGIRKGQTGVAAVGQISPENIIPREKFLVCALETEDADPRGISQIRAAYKAFLDKQETRQQFFLWRRKCAVRSLVATAPEKTQPVSVKDADGNPVVKNGVPVTISATKSIAQTLAKLENDTVAAFPFGTVVTPLETNGTGKQFEYSFNFNNQEIRKAILLQTMATHENVKGGLGTGGHEAGAKILARRIESFRSIVADLLFDLGSLLTAINFGEDARPLAPMISLGSFDKSELAAKLAAAIRGGYTLDASQFDELDAEFSFPRRQTQEDAQSTVQNAKDEQTDPADEDSENSQEAEVEAAK